MRELRDGDGVSIAVLMQNQRRRVIPRATKLFAPLAILAALTLPVWSQEKNEDLTSKSLEDLMDIEVTSASKKEQKLSHIASAAFVITETEEDIRRSGAANILLPGPADRSSHPRGHAGRHRSQLAMEQEIATQPLGPEPREGPSRGIR